MFFARKVKVIGLESRGVDTEIELLLDISEPYRVGESRRIYVSELSKYNTFKKAQNAAKKLNNMPENKKRLKRWIKTNFSQEMLEFKYRREI